MKFLFECISLCLPASKFLISDNIHKTAIARGGRSAREDENRYELAGVSKTDPTAAQRTVL